LGSAEGLYTALAEMDDAMQKLVPLKAFMQVLAKNNVVVFGFAWFHAGNC